VIRQNLAKLIPAYIQIGKEQMMVNDHNICRFGPDAHSGDKTGLEVGTFLPYAGVALGTDPVPERKVLRQVCQLGPVAGVCFTGPITDMLKMIDLADAAQNGLVVALVQPVDTGVVRTSLHIGRRKLFGQDLLQEWNVL